MKKDEIEREKDELERLAHKLKKQKKKMVSRGASSSVTKKIRKAFRVTKERIEGLEELG